jgi:hypothetical protein
MTVKPNYTKGDYRPTSLAGARAVAKPVYNAGDYRKGFEISHATVAGKRKAVKKVKHGMGPYSRRLAPGIKHPWGTRHG